MSMPLSSQPAQFCIRRDTGFLVFSFPRSLGSGVYDEINGGQRKLVRTYLNYISTKFRPIWMRFGARVSKTPCQNRNPWVQGLARCFAYTCTKSHPNRSKFGGDIVQIGAHQFSLSSINFVINSTPQGPWERKDQKTRVTPYLYCGTHQKDWAAWLPLAQYTWNSWPNASTKKSPYELILGYTPLAHQPICDMATIPDIDTRMQLIKNAREQAQDALKQTQEHMIKETKFKEFVIGQKVWLEGKNIKRPYDSPKLSPKRYGPFRVVAKISPVAYKLQIPAMWQIHDVFD